MVAENGVFVHNVDENTDWKSTSNLNLELPNTKCFKFGYDSSLGWPYIEFPTDIASLIGNGLNIDYIVTIGDNGNVSANYLTSISNSAGFYFYTQNGQEVISNDGSNEQVKVDTTSEDSGLIVKNTSASIGGSNPETIDSAYNNFKKTIGTFDTLVTCRDYANAIYNLYDEENVYPVVSNIQVADRRDDINYSNKILSLDKYGTCYTYGTTNITAFDLCLYPLKPITSYTADNYTDSFRPKLSTSYIKQSIEENKSISHDYKEIGANDIYAIINKYKLNVKLTTTYKVNNYERLSIIANVLGAIIKNFNAREVDYGEEIPYDSILNVIQIADERINYVGMSEPVPQTYFLKSDGSEIDISSSQGRTYYLNLLAKNILAGKISLFDFYNAFSFEFNQTDASVHTELEEIETHAQITLTSGVEYPLLENEAIQVVGPSFVTTVPYSYGVRYNYHASPDTNIIRRGTEYKLLSGETLTINYKPSGADEKVTKVYEEGQIIKPIGFDLVNTDTQAGTITDNGIKYLMLQSDQEIDIRELNRSTLNSFTYCYWLRNTHVDDRSNVLFTANDVTFIDDVDVSNFTSTSDYVGYYVLYNSSYTEVTNSNKDSLGITAGTTHAYRKYYFHQSHPNAC